MSYLPIAILVLAGALWLIKREEILSLHRVTIGGRFPMGCVVAEAIAILLIAAVAVVVL
jgi:hypothetical protein